MMNNHKKSSKKPLVEDEKVAMMIAGEILSRRPLSVKGLREKLHSRNVSDEVAEQVISQLLEFNYLNDEDFGRIVISSYKNKGYGVNRIRQELFKRGVEKEVSDQLLEEYETDQDKIDQYILKKMRNQQIDSSLKRKIAEGLLRKGFQYDEIKSRLDVLLNSEENEFWQDE